MRRVREEEEGQAAVEFALVLVPLMLIVVGILQFGLLFYNYIDLTSAARDGTRVVSISRTQTGAVEKAKTAIKNSTTVVDDSQLAITVTPAQPWNPGQDVTVKVSYPYSLNILGVTVWNGPMETESVVRVE